MHFFGVNEKKEIGKVKLPRGESVHALGFHPNEKWVALGMRGKVAIYDIEKEELIALVDTESVSYQNGLAFSTDGKLLATISQTSMDPIKIIEFGE